MKNILVYLSILILMLASNINHLFCSEGNYKVVMYWVSTHSFTENEHSLANWIKGGTANAIINSNGEIEMILDISGFPHVLSSPELNVICESFDAIRITYLNLLECTQEKTPKIAVGWIDEILVDKYSSDREVSLDEEIRYTAHPMKSNVLTTETLKFKGHKNWKKNVKVVGFNLAPLIDSDTAEGKLIISSIELIKLK